VAHENLINLREYEATRSFIEEYCLAQHDPKLARLLQSIRPEHASSLNLHLWQTIRTITGQFEAFHRDYPFVVAPPGTLDGRPFATPLRQLADDQSVTLDDHELAEHMGIFGRSGGGKTTCAQQFAHEAYRRGLSVLTIDAKEDARAFPILFPDTIVIGPRTPVPLLEPPAWLDPSAARPQLITPLKQTMWGGEGLQQVATESHQRTFARHARPCVSDWRDEVRSLAGAKDTYTRRDRCEGLGLRLDRLIDQYPGIATTRVGEGIPLDVLCTRSVYFGFGLRTEIEDFLTQWLLELRFSYNRANGLRTLNTFVLLDESNLLVHDKTIGNQAPLVATFPLLREFGISVCLTANNYRSLPLPIRSSLYLQLAMNLTDATEATEIARTFGHNDRQREYHDKKLALGTCIAKLGDRWKHPVVTRFQPLQVSKSVDATAWQAALNRTNALARTAAAREGERGWTPPSAATTRREQPNRATTGPPASVTSATSPVKSLSHNTQSPPVSHNRVALNKHCNLMMEDVSEHHLTLTTRCFRRCGLRLSEGERAKTTLTNLGFMESFSVRTGAGRGKTGQAMRLTPAGWKWIGKRPKKSTKGGDSVEHEFFVQHLSRLIPRSSIEILGVDLVIAYNTDEHTNLHGALEALSARPITLNTGDLLALEIETSSPKFTASRNVVKDAGFSLIVIATFAKDVASVQRRILSNDRVLLIDVLRLIDALRPTEAV
jgi:hypothetical protein